MLLLDNLYPKLMMGSCINFKNVGAFWALTSRKQYFAQIWHNFFAKL